jgi:succinate dehydrogenase / fumarate reductase iron-sulfur subunit
MNSRRFTLRIKRFHRDRKPSSWIDTFHLEVRKGMNLLEALSKIQDEQDASLSFRYSCRGAVCGSCAVRINGRLALACRTRVEDLEPPAFIEPLPLFPLIRDLIVDMSVFFENYRKIEPFLHGRPVPSGSEYPMHEDERKAIDPYIQCILCGICFGVCPAFQRSAGFLGPAMLAKAYRFFADSRDRRKKEILGKVNGQEGVWGCNTVFRCVNVCPKEVPPTHAIVKMRRKILRHRVSSVLSRLLHPEQSHKNRDPNP